VLFCGVLQSKTAIVAVGAGDGVVTI